jgi:uncharacterized protein YbaA (DUF1428 family)
MEKTPVTCIIRISDLYHQDITQRRKREKKGRKSMESMERYVDGFLIPIAKDKVNEYREMSQKAGEIWKELGALEYYECIGDDLDIEGMLSFKKVADTSKEETVIFSWIVFESREQRDRVNEAVMNDPRIKEMMESGSEPPFDYRRMAYGGFKTLVNL